MTEPGYRAYLVGHEVKKLDALDGELAAVRVERRGLQSARRRLRRRIRCREDHAVTPVEAAMIADLEAGIAARLRREHELSGVRLKIIFRGNHRRQHHEGRSTVAKQRAAARALKEAA